VFARALGANAVVAVFLYATANVYYLERVF
jgi:hypothetical protein